MTHEVETRMVAGGNLIWENLPGTVELPSNCDEREALEHARMGWRVVKQPIYSGNPDDGYKEIPEYFATVRDDTNAVLGLVKDRYHVVQNDEVAAFASAIVGTGECDYASAVVLRGGKRVFFVLEFPESYNVGPDTIKRYLLVASSHDGSMSLLATQADIRAECANTLRASLDGSDAIFKVRHTANVISRTDEARRILSLSDGYSKLMREQGEKMLARTFGDADWDSLLDAVYPLPEEEKSKSRTIAENAREELGVLFHGSENLENVRGTAWCAWQAFIEFNDHRLVRRNTASSTAGESRMESVLFGANTLTHKAFALLAE